MTQDPVAPPPQIPGFLFVKHLGSGGFADVYLYGDLGLGRLVAVKVISGQLSQEAVARFTDEANMIAALSTHPSIVTVYQAGVATDGRPYLVMEYCSQPNLDDRYRRGVFSEAATLQIGVEMAGAVETVHRAGILHRDIKPANVLTTDYGRRALADCGISGAVGTGIPGLSVPWSPPESFHPNPVGDARSDVYSLAATLYALLAGHSPFADARQPSSLEDLVRRILTQPLPQLRRSDVSDGMRRVLTRAMSKDPADRYESATALARALQRVQADVGLSQTRLEVIEDHPRAAGGLDRGDTRVHPPSSGQQEATEAAASRYTPAPTPERRFGRAAVAGLIVTLLLAAVGVFVIHPWRTSDPGSGVVAAGPATTNPTTPDADASTSSTVPSPRGSIPTTNSQEELDLPVGPAISSTQLIVPRYKKLTPPGLLWLVDSESPDVSRQLDAVQRGSAFSVGISPDRRTITYVDNGAAVRAVPAAGGSGRLLFTSPAGCGRINHKSWSPIDLSVFVLECQVGNGPRQLLVVDIDGIVIREIETGRLQPSDPTISPDGTTLAFSGTMSDSTEEGGSIYRAPVDGTGEPTAVTDSASEADSDPAWSPDGTSIAFRRRVGPPRGEKINSDNRLEDTDILTVAATGGPVRTLVRGSATDDKPAWSPDGLTIAFVSNRDADGTRTESKDIWLVSANGSQPTPLGLAAPRYSAPTWAYR